MPIPPDDKIDSFQQARDYYQRYQRAQRQQRLNNAGCTGAVIVCTLMVCITVLFVVWMIYG